MLADRVRMASITSGNSYTVNLIRNSGYIEYSINGGAYIYTDNNETLTDVRTIKFRAEVPEGGDEVATDGYYWWWYQLSVYDYYGGLELAGVGDYYWETPVIELSRDTTYAYSIDYYEDGISW